jgi:hypothetical protein
MNKMKPKSKTVKLPTENKQWEALKNLNVRTSATLGPPEKNGDRQIIFDQSSFQKKKSLKDQKKTSKILCNNKITWTIDTVDNKGRPKSSFEIIVNINDLDKEVSKKICEDTVNDILKRKAETV